MATATKTEVTESEDGYCNTCKFLVPAKKNNQGTCFRYPTPKSVSSTASHWCGEFCKGKQRTFEQMDAHLKKTVL